MRALGAPTIEVVDRGSYFAALEGSHRLAAADALGLVPILRVIPRDEVIDAQAYDWFDIGFFPDLLYPAGAAADRLHWNPGPVYRFA